MPQDSFDGPYTKNVLAEYRVDETNKLVCELYADLAKEPAAQHATMDELAKILAEENPEDRLNRLKRASEVESDQARRLRIHGIIEREAEEHVSAMLAHQVTPPHDVAKLVISLTLREPVKDQKGRMRGIRSLDGVERCVNLRRLYLSGNPIESLEPLEGLPIELLNATNTKVKDIRPLLKMKRLQSLRLRGSRVEDLSPLEALIRTRDSELGALTHDTHNAPTRRPYLLDFRIPAWAALCLQAA
jgi:hypothetical protein